MNAQELSTDAARPREDAAALPNGTRIVSILGERDADDWDVYRETGPGATGTVSRRYRNSETGEAYYSVVFEPYRVWVFLSASQLADPKRFTVLPALT